MVKDDVSKLANIRSLMDKARESKIRYNTLMSAIEDEWYKEYNTRDVEEVKKILGDKITKLRKLSDKVDLLERQLLEVTDWDKLAEELR